MICSADYEAGKRGWCIREDGSFEFWYRVTPLEEEQ